MGRKNGLIYGLVFVLTLTRFVEGYKKNPLKDPRICGRPVCGNTNAKFRYNVGSLYKYDYSMYVKTALVGSGDNTSELHISSVVEIDFYAPCQGTLKLYTIEVRDRSVQPPEETDFDYGDDYNNAPDLSDSNDVHPKSEIIAEELMRFELRFAFHDGTISEICHEDDEPVWTLNLKRGILSAMQNTMPRFDIDYHTTETDVSGICDVEYATNGRNRTSLLFRKTKDIASCKRRYKTTSLIQTVPYDFRPNYVAWPILNSTSYCDISVDNSIYKNVACYERHQLVPFSNGLAGAVTETYTKLELADEESYVQEGHQKEEIDIQRRSSLLYDHKPSLRDSHDELKASRELLKQLCALGFPNIKRDFPDVFLSFLTAARALSMNALYQLLTRSGSICDNGRNHIMESLPYIGTAASVTLMKDQIVKGEVSSALAAKWMGSFAYLTRPNEEVLEAMLELVDHGKTIGDQAYLLTATTVVNTFCRIHSECAEEESVQAIVQFLESELLGMTLTYDYLDLERTNREKMIVLLMALGNMGVVNKRLNLILRDMIESDAYPTEVRLQAVNVFRRSDCFRTKDYFLKVYGTFQMDTEVRIAAYLQAMRCPDYLSVKLIKHVLKTEEVNQVGSFVWSHLTNLANSASPVRVEAQGLLAENDLGKKFRLDVRKFSRNYEQTLFFDEYNFGMTVDSNVIFSTDSYLPRTVHLNLTTDLFGESVNFLELNVRLEGLEDSVHKLFGPNGTYSAKMVNEQMIKYLKFLRQYIPARVLELFEDDPVWNDDMEAGGDDSRYKRDTARQLPAVIARELQNEVEQLGFQLKSNFSKPQLTVGVKIFGNDMMYYTNGMELFKQDIQWKLLSQLFSGREMSYTKSAVFLDTSYDVPLSSGLPLALSIVGASSVDLRMTGMVRSYDFRKILADIESKIKPSVTVDVTATMKSDLMHANTAIKVKTNLYSSSAWAAHLKVRGKDLAMLQVSLPQDRNDIFSIRSEMFVFTDGREIRQAGIERRYYNSTCTWPFIDQAIGLKMCANYSLPDVSSSRDIEVPSLILSGPVNFDVSLEKADLTAKMFLLKYSWDERHNQTIATILFETPNSQIPRIFRANVTNEAHRKTATMSFVNGNISHKAVAIYINNPDQHRLETSLNVNDRKYLALEMGYNRTGARNGLMYFPSFYLSVNNERIAGLGGQVKQTEKNNITQWDYTVMFETKRLRAKAIGYVSISYNATYMIHNSMEYRFSSSKLEHLVINAMAEATKKDVLSYNVNFDLRSSAYPHFDVALNATYLEGTGRCDFTLLHNNAPDLKNAAYLTTFKIIFAHDNPYRNMMLAPNSQQQDNPTERTSLSFEVTRPRSRTDLKAMIVHENLLKKGLDHNVRLLVRYAPTRELTGVVSFFIPRTQLFWFDGAFNLTVPGFHPFTINIKIKEKAQKEHSFDFRGVWFSAHALNVSGWYKDRSSVVKTYHHAKLVAQTGPTFREVFGDLKYIRDENDNMLHVRAKYDKKPYGIVLHHKQQPENGTSSYAELIWKDGLYWFSALMKSAPIKQLDLELHIDKVRDVSMSLRGYSTAIKREVGVEFKWDANRDPTQRIALSGELNTPTDRTYDGLFLVSYPNRTFSGTFDLKMIDPRYLANARISWNTTEAIEIRLDAGTDDDMLRNMWLLFKLNTPFHGWRHNELSGGFYFKNNQLRTNVSAYWAEDQNLGLELMGYYLSNDTDFNCELQTKLHSSIQNVPTAMVHLKHKYDPKRIETICTVNHTVTNETPQVFSVRSNLQFETDVRYRNVTGSLKLISPFEGYQTGALVAKFSLSENRTLTGAADLQLDDDKYEMVLVGHVRNLVDCMLTANVTSSNVNYRNINGRFGISEKDRHIVAEVITPKSALGVELLYAVVSSQNFDIKFHLATPLKDLEKLIFRGKLQMDNIDFRVGMNNMVLGCTGVWRKVHLKDFEYSYRIYTPLQKFEESALIVKLVINSERQEYVDVELSGKFSEYKMGLKVVSKPKPKLIRQLLPQTASSMVEEDPWSMEEGNGNDADEEDYEDEEEEQDVLNFIGDIELYTIVLPTIEGTIELTEHKSQYRAIGKVKLPQGDIDIRDRFYLKDLLNMQNSLRLKTPFPVAKDITSDFVLKYAYQSTDITLGMNVKFNNRSEWVNTGFHVNYKYSLDEAEVHKHQALVDLMTPMKDLQKVFLNGSLELEDHSYKGNLTAKTMTTDASLALSFESEDQFIDTFMSVWVRAPLMPYYACRVFYKQDFSNTDNSMDLGFMVNDGDLYSNFRMDGTWSFASPHFINGVGKYQSNFLPINLINTDLLITRSPFPKAHWNVKFHDKNGIVEEIKAKAERNREMFTIDLSVPMEDYRNLSIHGRLQHRQGSEYTVSGQLYRNEYVFQLEGDATIIEDIPYRAELAFQPLGSEGSVGSIRYHCAKQSDVTIFKVQLESGDRMAELDGSFKLLMMSDWFVKLGVLSSEPSLKNIDFTVGINPEVDGKALGKFNLRSPWVQYGIDQADVEMVFDVRPISGSVVAWYGIREVSGNASCLWNWALKSDMQFALENRVLRGSVERYFRTGVRYVSPDRENNHNFTFGGDLNLNNIWIFSANASVDFISIRDLSAVMKVLLPKPVGDVHTLALGMNGNLPFVEPVKSFNMETSYETDESRKRYAYHTEYSFIGDLRALLRFEWGPDVRKQRIQSNLNVFRIGDRRQLLARLRGPWYLEDAFEAHGTYDLIESLYLVSGNISIPASTQVASANVAFNNLSNMKGDMNCTTPFLNVTWIHGQLEFIETPLESIRYLKGTWPESSAVFDAKAIYRNQNLDREQQGTIKIEVPLQTRHYAEVKYGLAQRPAITIGHAEVDYNSEKVLSGQYTSKEESRAGFDRETIDVTLENQYMPVGVHYVHSLNMLDAEVRALDIKRAEVFQLRNQKNFNITGELHVLSKETGREYIVKAIHPNRTVVLTADFEQEDNVNKKKSKLQLSPTVWIAYDFQLVNRSRDDKESQNFTLQISYPKRNITADGWYSYTEHTFDSDITLSYSPNQTNVEEETEIKKQRTVRGAIEWRDLANGTTSGQRVRLALGHPSFQQDVTLDTLYFTDPKHWFSSKLELCYNDDDDQLVSMGFNLNDLRPIVGYWNYSYHLFSTHEASDLDLDSIGSVGMRHGLYGVSSNSHYKRAYLSQMFGHVLGSLNIQQKELHYERITSQSKYRLWTKAAGTYPTYMINGTLLDGTDVDANGFFYLNIDDRLVRMMLNVTPDGSENVYMYGIIPDSRSAYFDFWRNYDNSRVVDVTYYLKMNHSRLITGHMLWRPQIKSDLQEWVKDYISRMHNAFLDYTEFWIKHVYLETKDSAVGIYEAALPYVEGMLEDVAGLSVLQNDLEDLHHFLNASYAADDFYVRSAINFTITVLDELAIRNKITSLPKILTELWQVMGESGQALGKSIAWLMERIRQSYQKFMDIVGRIFQGDAMRYLSSSLEESLERYDKFVKEIHLQVIKNIQEMWEKVTSMASTFWHRMLQNIEPTIIRLAHYGESLGWLVGNEIFTFLYNKTQELADSPYFNTVTDFTQDLDMLYKDLVTNDVFTNVKKYSAVSYRFLREKYFQIVPFGREFHQVVMELVEEIKQLRKIEYVQFFIQRYEEVRSKVEWLAEEFQVESRLHQMWLIVRNKLSHIAQTALQAENHYREAKTKFIFDPDHGIMELEQKLPMSWHAFNETPKFEEIPEFKFINDIQDLFAGSNTTLWTLYNDICPFADPQMWLPPFKSVGLLIGSRHYMSFDKRFISMDLHISQPASVLNECRYLLAHDYHNRTFTLLLEPSVLGDGRKSRKISLITDGHTLAIDIFDISVKINDKDATALPALIGTETVVYRESDLLYVHSQRGFLLACSLRYHLCWLELNGWYFGKVAGLLGTMNNEPFDDRIMAVNRYSESDDQFLNSWALPSCNTPVTTTNYTRNYYSASNELSQLCDSFFRHKLSYFASCFPVVDVTPFYEMCLDLGNHLEKESDGSPSDRGACTAALAYIQACTIEDTLLRVPDSCISCPLMNGSHVPEGSFVPLRDENVPNAADIVFIVEAKPCNERFVQTKSINVLVDSISRELQDMNIRDTRYGVVAFGGTAPFDRAHSIVVGNSVFETHNRLLPFLEHISIGNGTNEDIFDAIVLASKLVFRPGASKTFILLPCSRCTASRMKLDFSSIVQLLIENDIKLHILADHELSFQKSRVSRLFYGMDNRVAYTKKDVKELVGDEELRRQIRLPKATLGECIALALETNGSVFGGHKLRQDRANTNNTKKFIKVFAKRIAATAIPNSCQTCECTGHNTGVAYMQCLPCHYPSPFTIEDGDMTDEMFLSVMQPDSDWSWDDGDIL